MSSRMTLDADWTANGWKLEKITNFCICHSVSYVVNNNYVKLLVDIVSSTGCSHLKSRYDLYKNHATNCRN